MSSHSPPTPTTPPIPEPSLTAYTKTRIARASQFAISRLANTTRIPTPTTSRILTLLQSACSAWNLAAVTHGETSEHTYMWTQSIRSYEVALHEQPYLHDFDADQQDEDAWKDDRLKLRVAAFAARYGAPGTPVDTACDLRDARPWPALSKAIKNEDERYKFATTWKYIDDFRPVLRGPVTSKIKRACDKLLISYSATVSTIHRYAARGAEIHNDIESLIANGSASWLELAELLAGDLTDVNALFGPEGDRGATYCLIDAMAERWFARSVAYGHGWVARFNVAAGRFQLEVEREERLTDDATAQSKRAEEEKEARIGAQIDAQKAADETTRHSTVNPLLNPIEHKRLRELTLAHVEDADHACRGYSSGSKTLDTQRNETVRIQRQAHLAYRGLPEGGSL